MKIIYKGDVHRLIGACRINVHDSNLSVFEFQKFVLEKNSLFYRGRMGNIVSFHYNTVLPDYSEAEDYVIQTLESEEDSNNKVSSCVYVDYKSMKQENVISDHDFRVLKKTYTYKRNKGK